MAPITRFSQLDLSKAYPYADYLTWEFDEFVEFIKGKVLRPIAGLSRLHQRYAMRISSAIYQYIKKSTYEVFTAPCSVRPTTGRANGDQQIQPVVQPDSCVVCDPARLGDRSCVGAPDWIIETLSPGNTTRDTRIKFDLYKEGGVRQYWIVYPGVKTVATFTLVDNQYKLTAEYTEPRPIPATTLPDLMVEWAEIFDE